MKLLALVLFSSLTLAPFCKSPDLDECYLVEYAVDGQQVGPAFRRLSKEEAQKLQNRGWIVLPAEATDCE